MNTLTDGSFSCSCLSSCWFSFELSGRCIQSLSSLFGVVLGSCIVCAKPWIITTMKEGPPKKGGQVRDSQKKIYIYIARTHHFVAPLCVVKGEKQSFEGQGSVPPRGCSIFFKPKQCILLLLGCTKVKQGIPYHASLSTKKEA